MKVVISSMSIQYFQNYIRSEYFARELVKLGHEVTLITASPKGKKFKFKVYKHLGVKIIVLPDIVGWRLRRGALGPFNFIARLIILLFGSFDIYHIDGHRPSNFITGLISAKLRSKVYISEWMDIFGTGGIGDHRKGMVENTMRLYDNYFEYRSRKLADGTIVLSNYLLALARENISDTQKMLLLHGGCDVNGIKNISVKDAREKLKIDQKQFIIGLVGVMDFEDFGDMDILLESISKMDEKYQKRINILFTGSDKISDDVKTKLGKAKITSLGWIPREDYNTFLCTANILFLPMIDNTRNRGKWPMKFGDFLAAGRPVIASKVGDIVGYFDKSNIGILVSDEVEQLQKSIIDLIDNPEKIEKMSEEARKFAENQLSWNHQAQLLSDFYSDVYKSKHKGKIINENIIK